MKIKSFIFLLLACFVAGCSSGPYKPKANAYTNESIGGPVVFLNEDLRRTLAVDPNIVAEKNENKLLKIQTNLRNRTDDEMLYIQVQTIFSNDEGMVLYSQPGSEAPWQTLTLSPNQTINYTQQALTAEASRFIIRIRYLSQKGS
jgi:hypothetical protein